MIRAIIKPSGIRLTGHAGFAPEGQDIVCAAATMLVYALARQLERDGILDVCEMESGEAIVYTTDQERAKPYLDMARSGFELLQESYGNFFRAIE